MQLISRNEPQRGRRVSARARARRGFGDVAATSRTFLVLVRQRGLAGVLYPLPVSPPHMYHHVPCTALAALWEASRFRADLPQPAARRAGVEVPARAHPASASDARLSILSQYTELYTYPPKLSNLTSSAPPLFSSTHTSCRWLLPACSCSPPWRLSLWGACQVLARTPTRAPEPAMVAAKNQSVRQGITAHLNQLTHNKTASASSRILLTPTIPFGHRAPILEVITRMLITYSSGFRPIVIPCQTAIAQSALAATAGTLFQHTLTAALLTKPAAVSQMVVS